MYLAIYRDEIVCDLAETYHVFDIAALPVLTVAQLVFGLRADSRVKMKMSNARYTDDQLVQAMICDHLAWLCWTKTKSAERGRNAPKSLYKLMAGIDEQTKKECVAFDTPEDFKDAWNRINERK